MPSERKRGLRALPWPSGINPGLRHYMEKYPMTTKQPLPLEYDVWTKQTMHDGFCTCRNCWVRYCEAHDPPSAAREPVTDHAFVPCGDSSHAFDHCAAPTAAGPHSCLRFRPEHRPIEPTFSAAFHGHGDARIPIEQGRYHATACAVPLTASETHPGCTCGLAKRLGIEPIEQGASAPRCAACAKHEAGLPKAIHDEDCPRRDSGEGSIVPELEGASAPCGIADCYIAGAHKHESSTGASAPETEPKEWRRCAAESEMQQCPTVAVSGGDYCERHAAERGEPSEPEPSAASADSEFVDAVIRHCESYGQPARTFIRNLFIAYGDKRAADAVREERARVKVQANEIAESWAAGAKLLEGTRQIGAYQFHKGAAQGAQDVADKILEGE